MRKILTGAAILALSTGLLTGCSGMIEAIEKSANYSDVEKNRLQPLPYFRHTSEYQSATAAARIPVSACSRLLHEKRSGSSAH